MSENNDLSLEEQFDKLDEKYWAGTLTEQEKREYRHLDRILEQERRDKQKNQDFDSLKL